MMVGDVADYIKLVAIVKKKVSNGGSVLPVLTSHTSIESA